MISILKLIVLIAITIIYYSIYLSITKEKYKSLFFITYISCISVFLYLCGMINILKIGEFFIIIFGFVLFLYRFKLIKQINFKKAFINYQTIFLLICAIWALFLTHNLGISHVDDYSHWYRICKMIYYENALPTNADLLYRTYPPGSAIWIYFISKFAGFNPLVCFLAQDLTVFACLQPFFLFIDEERTNLLHLVTIILGSIFICSLDETFYVLLVDSLVGLIPLCSWIIIYKKADVPFYILLFINIYTALIKSSAIVFSILIAVYYLINNKGKIKQFLALVICPIVLQFAYVIRSNIVYSNISSSAQALSLSRFMSIYNQKNASLVKDIIKFFIKSSTDFIDGIYQVKILWLCLFILLIVCILKRNINYTKVFIFSISSFIIYVIGLLLVYLFSMSLAEATGDWLACFDRYIGTISIFIFGIVYGLFISFINDNIKITAFIALPVILIIIFSSNFKFLYSFYNMDGYDDAIWKDLQAVADEEFVYNEKNIFAIFNVDDYNNKSFIIDKQIMQCYFRTIYVTGLSIEEMQNGSFNSWFASQVRSCQDLFTLRDYTKYLPIITKHINVKEYRPGFCNIEH